MVAPLLLDGRLLGVVYLDSRVAKGMFTAADVGVLAAITTHVAAALETARAAQLAVDGAVGAARAGHRRDAARRRWSTCRARSTRPTCSPAAATLIAARCPPTGPGWRSATATRSCCPAQRRPGRPGRRRPRRGTRPAARRRPPRCPADAPAPAAPAAFAGDRAALVAGRAAAGPRRGGRRSSSSAADRAGAYGRPTVEIAAALAGQGMIAYENAELFSTVEQLATTDGLTGLFNRRHFFELAGPRDRHRPAPRPAR